MRVVLVLFLICFAPPVHADLPVDLKSLSEKFDDWIMDNIDDTKKGDDIILQAPTDPPSTDYIGSPKELCNEFPDLEGCEGIEPVEDDLFINGIRP